MRQKEAMSVEVVVEDQPDIGQVLEDNVLALLDTVEVKNAEDIEDDKMSFIEAVYALCIVGTQPKAPTRLVHQAVFHLLEGNHSLVLNTATYSLLIDIAQEYPHILIKENKDSNTKREVVLNNKIWSPFRSSLGDEEKSKGVTRRPANQGQHYNEV
ncbi:hypothetical protein L7F22_048009 [Adiantum nelumboides]|nr:hypothetical protein [Adiantum nelumboides]